MNNYVFYVQWILDRKYGKNVRVLDSNYCSGEIVKMAPRHQGLPWLTPLLTTFILCAGVAFISPRVQAAYTVVELDANLPEDPNRFVRGLNDIGEVVGSGSIEGSHRGFLLREGVRQNINGLPDSDRTTAHGINLAGQVVGLTNTRIGVRAFRALRSSGILDLGTLPGDSGSVAYAVNDPGECVGFSTGREGVRAVKWSRAGAIVELPGLPDSRSSRAYAINDRGDAVGVSEITSGQRAVLWRGGSVHDLGSLSGQDVSEARGINNSGDTVGSSGALEMQQRRAVLWRAYGASSNITDLGVLPGGTSSWALGINDHGEVVGTSETDTGDYHAFLWTEKDGIRDLNELMTSQQSFILIQAVAISNPGGRILAYGWSKDIPVNAAEEEKIPHFYLLTKIP